MVLVYYAVVSLRQILYLSFMKSSTVFEKYVIDMNMIMNLRLQYRKSRVEIKIF